MIRIAKELSLDQKAVIESLLGRSVLEDEAISVRAIAPPELSDQQRQEIAKDLSEYFEKIDVLRSPGTPEHAEEILTEAIRSSRPDYRPHQLTSSSTRRSSSEPTSMLTVSLETC